MGLTCTPDSVAKHDITGAISKYIGGCGKRWKNVASVFLLDFLNVCTNQIQQIPTLSWWDNRYYGVIIVNSNNLFSNQLSISFNTISVNWHQIRTNYEIIFFVYIINTLHTDWVWIYRVFCLLRLIQSDVIL